MTVVKAHRQVSTNLFSVLAQFVLRIAIVNGHPNVFMNGLPNVLNGILLVCNAAKVDLAFA